MSIIVRNILENKPVRLVFQAIFATNEPVNYKNARLFNCEVKCE